jgi:hypothetical protein
VGKKWEELCTVLQNKTFLFLGGDFIVSNVFFGVMGQSNRLVAKKKKEKKITEETPNNLINRRVELLIQAAHSY